MLLPTAPQLEGTSLWDNRDPTGHYIMRGLVAVTKMFSRRVFSLSLVSARRKSHAGKIAYVRVFAPFGWVIGAGEYVFNVEADLQQAALRQLRNTRFGQKWLCGGVVGRRAVLVSPTRGESEGKLVTTLSGLERDTLDKVLAQARRGDGMLRYVWFTQAATSRRKNSLMSVHLPTFGLGVG